MANSSVPITAGVGTNVDVEVAADGDRRQVVVIGDPSVVAGVLPVDPVSGIPVHMMPVTTGGLTPFHRVATGSTNAANVKASAGQVYHIALSNRAAYPIYFKFHNNAGTPTAGAGVVFAIGLQAGLDRDIAIPDGLAFAAGIAITIVKGIADSDATPVLANDGSIDLGFK